MRPSETSLEQLRALVWDDVRLRERLYQPDDIRSFIAMVVASGRDHGFDLAAADIEAALQANRQAAPPDVGVARLPPKGWLPFRTHWQQGDLYVEWIYFGEQRLREPFFDDSIGRCRSKPFNLLFCHATPIGTLAQPRADRLQPTGFIFHMSRCGSTLVSQMLAAIPRNIVVSEASPIDAVVQARHLRPDLSEEQHAVWLAGMVGAFGVPSGSTRTSQRSGGTNTRLVSSNRLAWMRSMNTVKASPKAARVAGVGQMKSAIAMPPLSTTRSHSQPMRRACSTRSSIEKPRSRLMLARTSSLLNTTALSIGASARVNVVLPEPGRPITRILRFIVALSPCRHSGEHYSILRRSV
jgi:hypothetical protein